MSRFAGDNLFDSGPHRFEVGGIELRRSTHEPPGSVGVRIAPQGVTGRVIQQHGRLIADDAHSLRALTDAIEARIDGSPHELIDDHARAWSGTVMLAFHPGPVTRLGPRVTLTYRIEYLQLSPR